VDQHDELHLRSFKSSSSHIASHRFGHKNGTRKDRNINRETPQNKKFKILRGGGVTPPQQGGGHSLPTLPLAWSACWHQSWHQNSAARHITSLFAFRDV